MRWAERQKHWLSDPACYPLIAILGATSVFVAGFMGYFTLTAPDVQISPLKRYVNLVCISFVLLHILWTSHIFILSLYLGTQPCAIGNKLHVMTWGRVLFLVV